MFSWYCSDAEHRSPLVTKSSSVKTLQTSQSQNGVLKRRQPVWVLLPAVFLCHPNVSSMAESRTQSFPGPSAHVVSLAKKLRCSLRTCTKSLFSPTFSLVRKTSQQCRTARRPCIFAALLCSGQVISPISNQCTTHITHRHIMHWENESKMPILLMRQLAGPQHQR